MNQIMFDRVRHSVHLLRDSPSFSEFQDIAFLNPTSSFAIDARYASEIVSGREEGMLIVRVSFCGELRIATLLESPKIDL